MFVYLYGFLTLLLQPTYSTILDRFSTRSMIACPMGSFFDLGSCYFYLSSNRLDLSVDQGKWTNESVNERPVVFDHLAAKRCRFVGHWVNGRVHCHSQSFENPRIAVNWTRGREILQLQQRINQAQEISISTTHDYTIVYKPLSHVPSKMKSFLLDISHGTHRVSLEEQFRLERRTNRYICKKSQCTVWFLLLLLLLHRLSLSFLPFDLEINSCYNETRCGRFGRCENLGVTYRCTCHYFFTGDQCDQCKLFLSLLIECTASMK